MKKIKNLTQRAYDLVIFQAAFLLSLERLNIDGAYDVYLQEQPPDDPETVAQVVVDDDNHSLSAWLGNIPPVVGGKARTRFIEDTARHEALHVLLSEFAALAHSRHATQRELTRAEEALVVRLCNLGVGV
jgi:hypothetical protein